MIYKRVSLLVFTVLIIVSLTACRNDGKTDNPQEALTSSISEELTDAVLNNLQITESASTVINTELTKTTAATPLSTEASTAVTNAEIVDLYKKAAQKSNPTVKSEQKITLSDISINNGQFGSGMKFVKSIISVFLNNNSKETNGITGGYANLNEADVREAKIYKVGSNTAIEMVMHEQTDGANSNSLGGSVGHAISTVGDISVVTAQLNDLGLPIEISEKDTTIHYTKPTVKVLIDPNGKIIKGTWSYTVEIRLNNYKVGGTTVDNTSVIMDNLITVNGGFNK